MKIPNYENIISPIARANVMQICQTLIKITINNFLNLIGKAINELRIFKSTNIIRTYRDEGK